MTSLSLNTLSYDYHCPVMLEEAVRNLAIHPDGIYVDLTFGGGSYSKTILHMLSSKGRLFAFDQDEATVVFAKKLLYDQFNFIQGNFRFLRAFLTSYGVKGVNGIIADLGVSSHQLNSSERGFAARLGGPLDMRMNQGAGLTASEIVNTYSEKKLVELFKQYGEIKNSFQLVRAIIKSRKRQKILSILDFKSTIESCVPKRHVNKYYAKVFQALRIEVNDELGALKDLLRDIEYVMRPGGRLVILSYHSLEDRIVKNFIKSGNFEGKILKDIYGNMIRPFSPLHNKPLRPTVEELAKNGRARSARLRTGVFTN